MKLVDKLLLRELLGPFVFGVAAFSSVFFAGSHLLKLTKWLMNGMPLVTALKLMALLMPSIVVITLPMATLLAVLLGVGRLSGDSEAVALFAGGISLNRIMVPIVIFGILVSASSILLNEIVAPQANLMNKEIQAVALNEVKVGDQPFTVTDAGTNSLINVNGGMDRKTGILKNVTIIRSDKAGQPSMIVYAKRAHWAGIERPEDRYKWRLYNGYLQMGLGTDHPAVWYFSNTKTREIEIEKTPEELALFQKDTDQMSFSELSGKLAYLRKHPHQTTEEFDEMDVERWNKLALPLSSLVFALLAAPLGIRPSRSSSSVGFGLSILLILIYWIIWRYTTQLAVQGSVAPLIGAFTADILGVAAGMVLLKRAAK